MTTSGAPGPRPARAAADYTIPWEARAFQGERAGLVSRFLANTVDFVVIVAALTFLWAAGQVLAFLLNPQAYRFSAPDVGAWLLTGGVLLLLYLWGSWATTGRTYGDHLMGLHVVNHRGARMRWTGALLRAAFCVTFPIGILWVAMSHENRSVQDVVLRTSVIYDWETQVARRRRRQVDPVPEPPGGRRPAEPSVSRPAALAPEGPPRSAPAPAIRPLTRLDRTGTAVEASLDGGGHNGDVRPLRQPADQPEHHLRDGS